MSDKPSAWKTCLSELICHRAQNSRVLTKSDDDKRCAIFQKEIILITLDLLLQPIKVLNTIKITIQEFRRKGIYVQAGD